MKQFNLEEYSKNPRRKVITRDGDDYYTGGTEIYSSEAEAVSHAMKKFGYVKTVKVEWEE